MPKGDWKSFDDSVVHDIMQNAFSLPPLGSRPIVARPAETSHPAATLC